MKKLDEALLKLDELANPDTVRMWSMMGMDVSNYKGANVNDVKRLSRELGRDHELALSLWATGSYDAQLLAVFVDEGRKASRKELNDQVARITFSDLADRFSEEVVTKNTQALPLVKEWQKSDHDFTRRCAFITAGYLARKYKSINDMVFIRVLEVIERTAATEANWVKEGMMTALMNLGMRNQAVNEKAIAVCEAIGSVEVTYGQNTSEVPAPLSVLLSERIQAKLR